ncbi:hypothetical protein Bbelb_308130 [Branchiostoma belcheri]|nr:hypothetical protein Bbelb_308130 [Branchiostoma belcheri]
MTDLARIKLRKVTVIAGWIDRQATPDVCGARLSRWYQFARYTGSAGRVSFKNSRDQSSRDSPELDITQTRPTGHRTSERQGTKLHYNTVSSSVRPFPRL